MSRKKRQVQEKEGAVEAACNDSTSPLKKFKMLGDKFGGLSEEEVCKLRLPDHMRPGLDIIFVRLVRVHPPMRVGGTTVRLVSLSLVCRLASTQACTLPTWGIITATPTTTFVSTVAGSCLLPFDPAGSAVSRALSV